MKSLQDYRLFPYIEHSRIIAGCVLGIPVCWAPCGITLTCILDSVLAGDDVVCESLQHRLGHLPVPLDYVHQRVSAVVPQHLRSRLSPLATLRVQQTHAQVYQPFQHFVP